jgi:hypothetical protein
MLPVRKLNWTKNSLSSCNWSHEIGGMVPVNSLPSKQTSWRMGGWSIFIHWSPFRSKLNTEHPKRRRNSRVIMEHDTWSREIITIIWSPEPAYARRRLLIVVGHTSHSQQNAKIYSVLL